MPEVSVIIPAYNAAAFIREAVDSALAQRGVDLEVIVVDDGSTDETLSILEGYGNAIHVHRQKNEGASRARNKGVKMATGHWLAFLDADDQWLPDKLAEQLALADPSIGLVYTDRENFGNASRVASIQSEVTPLWEGDLFEPLLLGNFVTTSSVIIQREWFCKLGGFKEELVPCEDWDLWLRFSAAGGLAAVCRKPLTRYRWYEGSISRNVELACMARLMVLRNALNTPRGRQLPARLSRKAYAACWRCSAWHAQATHRWRALQWYLKAAWYEPYDLDTYKQIIKCCIGRD